MTCDHCHVKVADEWVLLRYNRGSTSLAIKSLCVECRERAMWQGVEVFKWSKDRSDLDLEILRRSL